MNPRRTLFAAVLYLGLLHACRAQSGVDDDDAGIDPGNEYWGQTYNLNGRNVTLREIDGIINQMRPKYGGLVVCADQQVTGVCCPAYCCKIKSSILNGSQPMDMSFKDYQTASVSGDFEILQQDQTGKFAALLVKNFDHPIDGGWTIEVNFSKAVLDLHSFNSEVAGTGDGLRTYYLRPKPWNMYIPRGRRELLVHGLTTPEKDDHVPLTAVGLLYYKPDSPAVRPPPVGAYSPGPYPATRPQPVPKERYNLAEVMQLSNLFYEAQRSGKLPPNNRIKWRGDSALRDGADVGYDLSGGWYDAGDHIKFTVPAASTVTFLLWGLLLYPDAWKASGELDMIRDNVRWELDYLLKTHTSARELYVQISDEVDHCYWEAPEKENYLRRSYKVTCERPGSQPVMDTAAAMAAGSLAFRETDPAYASKLLEHAKQLFDFAEACPGDYITEGKIPAQGMYDDGGAYWDEHAWAAAWLHKATGDKRYLERSLALYWRCCSRYQTIGSPWRVLSWADKAVGVNLLLYDALHWDDFAKAITWHIDSWITMPRTPKGLSYLTQWGSLRYAANAAFTALVAADQGLNPDSYRKYAVSQINYMLGDCCGGGASHLIGFGKAWPTSPHHRGSSCKGTNCSCTYDPNTNTLWGALVGGPSANDDFTSAGCPDFIFMETALDYNAGFTSAVAAMKQLSLQDKLSAYDPKRRLKTSHCRLRV